MTNAQLIRTTLDQCYAELFNDESEAALHDRSLAADLHAYYNKVGMNEGWLKQEYAKPLSKQSARERKRMIGAALSVVRYWYNNIYNPSTDIGELVSDMHKAADYRAHRGNTHLEDATNRQYDEWKLYVGSYLSKSVPKFMPKYSELSEHDKDQERLIVAVVTDRILARALEDSYRQKFIL